MLTSSLMHLVKPKVSYCMYVVQLYIKFTKVLNTANYHLASYFRLSTYVSFSR